MNITAYEVYDDERRFFAALDRREDVKLRLTPRRLEAATLDFAKGCEGVSVLDTSQVDAALLDGLAAAGVRYLSTRTIGYNHIAIAHAAKAGIRVSNVSYGPDGVADYTVMLILMCLRKCKQAVRRAGVNDYSLAGLEGRELRSLTVGIVGTGHIGRAVLRNLGGFGCTLLASDSHPHPEVEARGLYVPLDELYRRSDIISLHLPLSDASFHMIDAAALARMKDGVTLINTARGGLADTEALIAGIESGRIGALGLDVIEHEEGIYRRDLRTSVVRNPAMAYLRQFPNVVMTPHLAFYTEEAVESMVTGGVMNLLAMQRGEYSFEIRDENPVTHKVTGDKPA